MCKDTTTQGKKYDSVIEMFRDISDNKEFCDELERLNNSRHFVKQLQIHRALRGLSQQAVASAMKCSRSKVSRIENGRDADVSVRDFVRYAEAIDCWFTASRGEARLRPAAHWTVLSSGGEA